MKRFGSILFVSILLSSLALAGVEMRLQIKGLRSSKGDVLVSLFDSKQGFPSEHAAAFRSCSVGATTNAAISVTFTNLPAGKYAVAVCHDENADGKMNRRMFGPPVEGWAVHRAQKPRLGPPKFEESAFGVSTADVEVVIHLVYPGD